MSVTAIRGRAEENYFTAGVTLYEIPLVFNKFRLSLKRYQRFGFEAES